MRVIVCFVLFYSFLATSNALALSCSLPAGIDLVDYYDVIFKGRAISTKKTNIDATNEAYSTFSPNTVTTFVISKHYQGKISNEVDIIHSSRREAWGKVFDIDEYMLIFAKFDSETNQIISDLCAPTFKVNHVPQNITDILIDLTKQKELKVDSG